MFPDLRNNLKSSDPLLYECSISYSTLKRSFAPRILTTTSGIIPTDAASQADMDFDDYAREMLKKDLTLEAKVEAFEEYFGSEFDSYCWNQKHSGHPSECRENSESSDPLEAMDPDKLWRHLYGCAGLTPQQVIRRFDRTIDSKDESLAVKAILSDLREQFKATGASQVAVEAAIRGLEACVGLM